VEAALLHHESRPENFRRTFELDPSIDANKIGAKVDQGLMTLTLPKAEPVKPRNIAVSQPPVLWEEKAANRAFAAF
jgi:HSP20 family molecular chaperone IbpA